MDMIFMLLADIDNLRSRDVRRRQKTVTGAEAGLMADADGFIKGRDAEGNPIKGKVTGKSVASRLAEKARLRREKEKAAEQEAKRAGTPKKRRKR